MVRVELELHEAMVVAMVRRRRFTIPAQELADAVCEDGTYLRGDKKPPPRSLSWHAPETGRTGSCSR